MREYYTIKDLRREFDITARTLRYYEEEGLLQPLRQESHRLYTQSDYNRLQQILRAKRLGFSLKDIAKILTIESKQSHTRGDLRQILDDIERQRLRIHQMRTDIDHILRDLESLEDMLFERLAELGVAH